MKKTPLILLVTTILLSSTLTACSLVDQLLPRPASVETSLPACPTTVPVPVSPAEITSCPAEESAVQPVLYSLWMKEQDGQRSLITFTDRSVYLVVYDTENEGAVRETFYDVKSIDMVNGILNLKMRWVRVNGRYGGYDDPSKRMQFIIDGEALYFSIVSEGMDLPAQPDNGPWLRQ